MRYNTEHKEQSRRQILEAARQLFRLRGFDAASIDEVMGAAGLTRGAFYAHFDSKDELVHEVLAIEAGLVQSLQRAAREGDPRTAAIVALSQYLDPSQRDEVASGCPLVAHPVDAIRGRGARQDGYTERLQALIQSMGAIIGDQNDDAAVLAAVVTVAGGLLSAASADAELADRIQRVCLAEATSVIVGR